jgi:hypothetical protein
MSSPFKPLHFPKYLEVVDWAMAGILQAKTEAERLAISWRMWKSARDMLRTLLGVEHPDWSEDQVRQETARRLSRGTR